MHFLKNTGSSENKKGDITTLFAPSPRSLFRFQLHMSFAFAALLFVSVIGCDLTHIHVHSAHDTDGLFMASIMLILIGMYWKDEKHPPRVMAILVLPWILILIPLMIFPMLIAAHLALPLQDAHLARIDSLCGIDVPAMAAWAAHHWLGHLINRTYTLLAPLIVLAVLLPIFSGRLNEARKFLVANVTAIALGVTAFCLVPAVGPWYPHVFSPDSAQILCQRAFMALRHPGPYSYTQTVGVICFPSFHVIWSILSAAALWTFKPLRIPTVILSTMIVVSTMTTGWHYFSDVIGGVLIALIAITVSRVMVQSFYNPRQAELPMTSPAMQEEQNVS